MTDTTETSMRERIARAILDGNCRGDHTQTIADAVLDAMREPSSGQRKAAQKAHDKWGASSSMLLSDLFNDIWRAMIDAAKEGE